MTDTTTLTTIEGHDLELSRQDFALLCDRRDITLARLTLIDDVLFAYRPDLSSVNPTPLHVHLERASEAADERTRRAHAKAARKAAEVAAAQAVQARLDAARADLRGRRSLNRPRGTPSVFASTLAASGIIPVSRYPTCPFYPKVGAVGADRVQAADGTTQYPGPRQYRGLVYVATADTQGELAGITIVPLAAFESLQRSELRANRNLWLLKDGRLSLDTKDGPMTPHDALTSVGCPGERVLFHRLAGRPVLVDYSGQPTEVEVSSWDAQPKPLRNVPGARPSARSAPRTYCAV